MYPTSQWTAEQLAHVHAQARRRAQYLRRVAVAEFWQGVHHYVMRGLRTPQLAWQRICNRSRQTSGV